MSHHIHPWETAVSACQPSAPACLPADECRRQLIADFTRLVSVPPDAGLCWKGTKTDLLELVYLTATEGAVRSGEGLPLSMSELARQTADRLHVGLPRNIYEPARRARLRKGVKRQTMLERYTWLRNVAGVARPLDREVAVCAADTR